MNVVMPAASNCVATHPEAIGVNVAMVTHWTLIVETVQVGILWS